MPNIQMRLALVLVCALFSAAAAQERSSSTQTSSLTITANASGDRVRVTAPPAVVQMRLEVYAATGVKLFDEELRGANVFDWRLQDGQAQRLPEGDYVCVVTAKTVSGKITQKVGAVTVSDKSASVRAGNSQQFTSPQAQAIGPVETDSSWTVVAEGENQTTTVIADTGSEGQMIRGRGALTFRLGDFFSGKDQEQMRLTEEGNLGIGTSTPQAKLDVAGAIRAERFLIAKPGKSVGDKTASALATTDSSDSVQPLVGGTGTTGQLTKWTDGANGTLGDSVVSESGGNIGIGTASPSSPGSFARTLVIQGAGSASTVLNDGTSNFEIGLDTGHRLRFIGSNAGNAITVNTNGNVGFGTASPTSPGSFARTLVIQGAGSASAVLNDGTSNFEIGIDAGHRLRFIGSSAGNAFTIDTTGNVGVGTASPTSPGSFARSLVIQGAGSASAVLNDGTSNFEIGIDAAHRLRFIGSSAGNPLTLDAAGKVGIGNTTPASKLDVAGDINTSSDYNIRGSRVLSVDGTNNVFAGVNAGTNNTGSENAFFGRGAGFKNTTGNGNSFFGSQAGNQGVEGINNSFFGASAGFNTIHDSSNTGFTDYNSFFGAAAGYSNTTGGHNAFFGDGAGLSNTTGGSNAFFGSLAGSSSTGEFDTFVGASAGNNNRNGNYNTLIGSFADVASGNLNHATAIGAESSVSTSNSISLGRGDGSDTVYVWGVLRTGLDGSGSLDVCRNTDLRLSSCSSSLRYKTGIQPFTRGLDVVRRLRPITFSWKDGGMSDVGFGAEDVEQVEPLLTTRNDQGEIEGVKYKQITTVLVNAIKEQQDQIAALRTANTALNTRLRLIERTLKNKRGPTRQRR